MVLLDFFASADEPFEELVIKYQTSGIPKKYADGLALLHDDAFRATCDPAFQRLHARLLADPALGPKAFRTDDDIAGEEARKRREAAEAEAEKERRRLEKRRQRERARRASAKAGKKASAAAGNKGAGGGGRGGK